MFRRTENDQGEDLRRENRAQLVRWHDFELGIGTILRFLVRTPSAELRHVPESPALHVLVRNFNHQLGPQRFPRQIFSLTPPALAARYPLPRLNARILLRPGLPRMVRKRILPVRLEEIYEFTPLCHRKAGADADVLQHPLLIVETQQ